ncbi:transglutaminase domain-containing protein [Mycoplasmopsis ciconiae]|uniref:Transglutaminase domain-containing protein n=1 Tax=Mycoplasmopsis ciconiae TaxID=561067 RepID=A0ABU7MMY7_9BACT|nr:transglutaminase domain-containing protein [Mycoplasmopsis ciconiae]
MKKKNKIISLTIATFTSVVAFASTFSLNTSTQTIQKNTNENLQDNLNNLTSTTINQQLLIQKSEDPDLDSFNTNVQNDQFNLYVNDKNEALVANYLGSEVNLTIPSQVQINGQTYTIKRLGAYSFFQKDIESVTFANSITHIEKAAFANNFLQEVNLPKNLLVLGDNAFSNNMFTYRYALKMPPFTKWNKDYQKAPFDFSNNYSKIINHVANIIQNQVVYTYAFDQQKWVIRSFVPSISELNHNDFYEGDDIFRDKKEINDKQAPFKKLRYSQMPIAFNSNDLSTYSFNLTTNDDNKAIIYFDKQNNQIKTKKIQSHQSNNQTFALMQHFSQTSKQLQEYKINRNLDLQTLTYANNDIIGFKDVDTSKISYSISSNYDNQFEYQNFNNLNNLYNINISVSKEKNNANFFIVKKDQLLPFTQIFQPDLILDSNNTLTVKGVATPNSNIILSVKDTNYDIQTDKFGNFYFSLPNSNLTTQDLLILSDGVSMPYYSHARGQDLINKSNFFFDVHFKKESLKFKVALDQVNNSFKMNQSNIPFSWQTQDNVYNDHIENSSQKLLNDKNQSLKMILSVFGKNPLQSVTLDTSKTLEENAQILQQLKWNLDDQLEIQIVKPRDIGYYFNVVNDNNRIKNQEQKTHHDSVQIYNYKITQNGLVSLDVTNQKNWNEVFDTSWKGNSFLAASTNGDGSLETDGFNKNWYNPSKLMDEVIAKLTKDLSTDYEKATAISQWISQNMHYTFDYAYGHTIDGTFTHLMGVCGNFANLFAVMAQRAGMVTRVIIGNALQKVDGWSSDTIDHAWAQIWSNDLKTWLTFDPTWNWIGPIGMVENTMIHGRSAMLVALVLWPVGTDYYSHFRGYEHEALNNLNSHFAIQQGRWSASPSLYSGAAMATFLEKVQKLNEQEYASMATGGDFTKPKAL